MKTHARPMVKPALITLLLLCVTACGDGTNPVKIDPHAPVFGSVMSPVESDGPQFTDVTFRWSCTDPDNDPITYTLFLGESREVYVLATGLTESTYLVTGLKPDQDYYWRVAATDTTGRQTYSARRHFTTLGGLVYPLEVGRRWAYQGVSYGLNFDFSPVPGSLADTVLFYDTVSIESLDTLNNVPGLFRFVESVWSVGPQYTVGTWMKNSGRGLFQYARQGEGAGVTPLKSSSAVSLFAFQQRFNSIRQLCDAARDGFPSASLQSGPTEWLDPPRQSLAYPLQVGLMWTALYNPPLKIKKLVTDSVSVATPAGTFGAYEIKWRFYFINSLPGPGPEGQGETQFDDPDIAFLDSSVTVTDYIASIGLVKRVYSIKGVIASDLSGQLGTFDIYEEWNLTGYSVPKQPVYGSPPAEP